MKKFAKRQEILNFKCVCEFCKQGKESDIDIFEDFEKINQERERIAIEGMCAYYICLVQSWSIFKSI